MGLMQLNLNITEAWVRVECPHCWGDTLVRVDNAEEWKEYQTTANIHTTCILCKKTFTVTVSRKVNYYLKTIRGEIVEQS